MMRSLVSCALLSTAAATASASTLTFDLTAEFSGGQNPTSPGPWGRATFTDTGSNTVSLFIESLLAGDQSAFCTGWYFNLNPALNVQNLVITGGRGAAFGDSIQRGTNAFQADGDGLYDILFNFDNAPPANRFDGNESVTFQLTMSGLSVNSFNFLSAPAGGHGPFTHVGRIQGTGVDDQGSGWFTSGGPAVPLPTAAALASFGFVGLGLRRRR